MAHVELNKHDPYECGYRARLRGCHRVLCNYQSQEVLRQWQRGWDDAALRQTLEQPKSENS